MSTKFKYNISNETECQKDYARKRDNDMSRRYTSLEYKLNNVKYHNGHANKNYVNKCSNQKINYKTNKCHVSESSSGSFTNLSTSSSSCDKCENKCEDIHDNNHTDLFNEVTKYIDNQIQDLVLSQFKNITQSIMDLTDKSNNIEYKVNSIIPNDIGQIISDLDTLRTNINTCENPLPVCENNLIVNNNILIKHGYLNVSFTGITLMERLIAGYSVVGNKVHLIMTEKTNKITIDNLCGKINIGKLPIDISGASFYGQISIFSNENNQLYSGIILLDSDEYLRKPVFMFKLSNRPLLPLGFSFGGIISVEIKAITFGNVSDEYTSHDSSYTSTIQSDSKYDSKNESKDESNYDSKCDSKCDSFCTCSDHSTDTRDVIN